MRSSKPPSVLWYLLGALPGLAAGILLANVSADRYIQTHPGEEYDVNLLSIIKYLIVPVAGIGGALAGIMLVGLMRAPRVTAGWIALFAGSAMVLAILPIRATHGWWVALGDMAAGTILIGIGLKSAK